MTNTPPKGEKYDDTNKNGTTCKKMPKSCLPRARLSDC